MINGLVYGVYLKESCVGTFFESAAVHKKNISRIVYYWRSFFLLKVSTGAISLGI